MADIIIPEGSPLYKELTKIANTFETADSVLSRLVESYKANPEFLMGNFINSHNKPPKQKITLDVVEEIYNMAKRVYEADIGMQEAVESLKCKAHSGSIHMYIKNFESMRTGKRYTRTMNAPATRYFLKHIFEDYQAEGLEKAIESLNIHIDYFEKFMGGSKMKNIRIIRDEFTAKLTQ